MNEQDTFPLDALIRLAKQTHLIDDYRKTEWVVVLEIDGDELVMNHAYAQVFLQGMVRGALRTQQLAEGNLRDGVDEVSTLWTEDNRFLVR